MKLSTNKVTLIGFVGGDAQAKETRNHNKYAVVSLATTEAGRTRTATGNAGPRGTGWS